MNKKVTADTLIIRTPYEQKYLPPVVIDPAGFKTYVIIKKNTWAAFRAKYDFNCKFSDN